MYWVIELTLANCDLHHCVWGSNPKEVLKDYHMIRLTFGVFALSFVTNMAVKQNTIDHAHKYPLAVEVVEKSFYVDDCLSEADNPRMTIMLQQHHNLSLAHDSYFDNGTLSVPSVLHSILEDLKRFTWGPSHLQYKWIHQDVWSGMECHHRSVSSDNTYNRECHKLVRHSQDLNMFGWFYPVIAKVLQCLWESKVDWYGPVPQEIYEMWSQWRSELFSLLFSQGCNHCVCSTTQFQWCLRRCPCRCRPVGRYILCPVMSKAKINCISITCLELRRAQALANPVAPACQGRISIAND